MFETKDIIMIIVLLCGFVGQAMYLKGVFSTRIDNNEEDIKNLKNSVRYTDTCKAMFNELKGRLSSLERIRNSLK